MRYLECVINSNSNQIKSNAKIRLNDYDYDSPVAAVNRYIYKNLLPGVQFFMYREESNTLNAVITYHEDQFTCKNAYTAVLDALETAVDIDMGDDVLEEITIYQFLDHLLEARRRGFIAMGYHNFLDKASEFVFNGSEHKEVVGFLLEEKIISNEKKNNYLCHESLCKELRNIEEHKNKTKFEGNLVHYVVSAKSIEAALDITETLGQSLLKANRINSRRIEIVREMDHRLCYKNGNLEDLIAGNSGGIVVLDLTEKFGDDATDYSQNCLYIEKLVKKYKNSCLFVFVYNMDHPGFAFNLLPNIYKYVAMVKIKEGTESRENATKYLKELIKASDYSKFAKQAGEFLEIYRGDKFSQTDILDAFEKFEPWCLNRNYFGSYSYGMEEDFFLDRDEDMGSASEKLNEMIGLKSVKRQINKIMLASMVDKERKEKFDTAYQSRCMHMVFKGNPGSAKTTVARHFAGLAKERGVLKSGIFVERGGSRYNSLAGSFNLRKDFEAAKGGVLFIDEAYAIALDSVITTLIREMENNKDDVIVILAGYGESMQEFMNRNDGLKSRIPYWVNFPDYSADELTEIFELMVKNQGFSIDQEAVTEANLIFEKARFLENFGNGRYVRNLLEDVIQNQSVRLLETYETLENIPEDEMFYITSQDVIASSGDIKEEREVGNAKKDLEDMIGITDAKKVIDRAVSYFKMMKLYKDRGINKDRVAMHMVFTGNPGTAKTTTARLLASILSDEKVLPSGKFVEVGRADLVGTHVGATAPLVKKRFKEAKGGVLFIDEAYSLDDGLQNGYGDEAINTIVQEMENHREDVIVIFAGYTKEMEHFLERNPGMASRIAFRVDFNDYSTDELCDIAKLMLSKKKLAITDEAMDKLRNICDKARVTADYGNGRFVRNIIEEAEMNLAQRLSKLDAKVIDMALLTAIQACDISEHEEKDNPSVQMGFRAS